MRLNAAGVKGGKAVDCMTGAEALESLPQVKDIVADGSGGGIWLLGDRITPGDG
jgi:hypothetical protein